MRENLHFDGGVFCLVVFFLKCGPYRGGDTGTHSYTLYFQVMTVVASDWEKHIVPDMKHVNARCLEHPAAVQPWKPTFATPGNKCI